jgi:hypothetical protein
MSENLANSNSMAESADSNRFKMYLPNILLPQFPQPYKIKNGTFFSALRSEFLPRSRQCAVEFLMNSKAFWFGAPAADGFAY